MTAMDRPRTSGLAWGSRQLHSTRPDLIQKITVLRQRLAALEGALASSEGSAQPDAGDHREINAPEVVSFAFADDTPSPRLRNGAESVRMRQG